MFRTTDQANLSSNEVQLLRNNLLEEWKLIQPKIDKIGEFRFNVKNWSMTATVAYLAALFLTKASWKCATIAIFTPGVFWVVEKRQELLQNALSKRAGDLEGALDRLSDLEGNYRFNENKRAILKAVGTSPGLAISIDKATRRRWYRTIKILEATTFYTFEFLLVIGSCFVLYVEALTTSKTEDASNELNKNVLQLVISNKDLNADIEHLVRLSEINMQHEAGKNNAMSSGPHTATVFQSDSQLHNSFPDAIIQQPDDGPNAPPRLDGPPYEFKINR